MNKVVLMGRLCADPDVKYTQGQNSMAVARYRLAVDRKAKQDGEKKADFISCVAFGKAGEFAEKYLVKGTKIAVVGRIQTGSYDKDGQTIYTTDVIVEEHYFCESRQAVNPENYVAPSPEQDGFMPVDVDDDLPF